MAPKALDELIAAQDGEKGRHHDRGQRNEEERKDEFERARDRRLCHGVWKRPCLVCLESQEPEDFARIMKLAKSYAREIGRTEPVMLGEVQSGDVDASEMETDDWVGDAE